MRKSIMAMILIGAVISIGLLIVGYHNNSKNSVREIFYVYDSKYEDMVLSHLQHDFSECDLLPVGDANYPIRVIHQDSMTEISYCMAEFDRDTTLIIDKKDIGKIYIFDIGPFEYRILSNALKECEDWEKVPTDVSRFQISYKNHGWCLSGTSDVILLNEQDIEFRSDKDRIQN